MTVVHEHLRETMIDSTPGQEPRPWFPRRTRRLGLALVCCGAATVVWLLGLARSLPATAYVQHWSAMWVGLDALEALGLTATGVLLLRRDAWSCLTAAATAALLVVDAWFDILTSLAAGTELAMALAMALGAELPLATLCVVVAVRSLPRQKTAGPPRCNPDCVAGAHSVR